MSAESKCNCQYCNGHISFPSEMAGQTKNCPHCQLETLLFIPPSANQPKTCTQASKVGNKAVLAGVGIILLVLVGVAIIASKAPKQNRQTSLENLKPVDGAFGWKLGDKLPEELKAQVRHGGYNFRPSEKLPPFDSCVLRITDDGRIYSIEATGYPPDKGEDAETYKNALVALLTDKYGRRPEGRDFTFSSGENYFFGSDDQTAHLNIYNRSLITLEYYDKSLQRIAANELETKQKKKEEEKKSALSKGL